MGRMLRPLLVLGAAVAVLASTLGGAAAQEEPENNAPTFTTDPKSNHFLATKLVVGDNQTLVGPPFKADDQDTNDTLTYTLSDRAAALVTPSGSLSVKLPTTPPCSDFTCGGHSCG